MKQLIYLLLLGVLVVGCTKNEDSGTELIPNVSVSESGLQVYDSQYKDLSTGIAFGNITGKQAPYKTIKIVNKSKESKTLASFTVTEPLFYLSNTESCRVLGVNNECQIEIRFTMNNSPKKNYTGELKFGDVTIPLSITVASDNCPLGSHTEEGSCLANQKSCIKNEVAGISKWTGSAWGECLIGYKRLRIDTISQLTYDKQFDITTNDSALACSAGGYPCALDFFPNSVVTLAVNYNSTTHTFSGWGGDALSCGQNPVCQLTADSDKSIVIDIRERKFNLVATVEPAGAALLSGYDPLKKFSYNGYSEIVAQANPGFKFIKWVNLEGTPNDNCHELPTERCVLSVTKDISLKAVFEPFAVPTAVITKTSAVDNECFYRVKFSNPDADPSNNFDRYLDTYQGYVKYDIFNDLEITKSGNGTCSVQQKTCVSNYCDLKLACFGEGTGTFRVRQNIIKNISNVGNQDSNSPACTFTDNVPPVIAFTTPAASQVVNSALDYAWIVNDPTSVLKFELFGGKNCTGILLQTIDYTPGYTSQHFDITDANYYTAKVTGKDPFNNIGSSGCSPTLIKQGVRITQEFGDFTLPMYKSANYFSYSSKKLGTENSILAGFGVGLGDTELYKINLTTGKFEFVKDICPGLCSSNPSAFVSFNNKMVFSANNGANTGLWVSDGTTTGTSLLMNNVNIMTNMTGASNALQYTYSDYYQPHTYETMGGYLYLINGATNALVKTDGTSGNSSTVFTFGGQILGLYPLSTNKILISAYHASFGIELWVSDGTNAGTLVLKDINAGAANNSLPSFMNTLPDGRVLFSAYTNANGAELWVTDGTAAGTVMLKEILAGTGWGTAFYQRANYNAMINNKMVFVGTRTYSANEELWISDGTATGTVVLWDGNTETASATNNGFNSSAAIGGMADKNGKVYFCARTSSTTNMKLFVYDGTSVTMLKDLGFAVSQNGESCRFNVAGSSIYVATFQNLFGNTLGFWKTDGTVAGTVSANAEFLGVLGTPIQYASAFNYSPRNGYSKDHVWITQNLTDFKYMVVKDFLNNTTVNVVNYPQNLPTGVLLGNKIIYADTFTGYGQEIAAYDLDTRTRIMLKDIYTGANSSVISELTLFNGKVYFVATSIEQGRELWVTDGTATGTKIFRDTYVGSGSSNPSGLKITNNKLWFSANDGVFGVEYYFTDGTSSGSGLFYDLTSGVLSPPSAYPGNGNTFPREIVTMQGIYYFISGASEVGANTNMLYKSFGNISDTATLINCANCSGLITLDNKILFSNYSAAAGYELWVSDGTPVGTVMLKDIYPGTASSNPTNFTLYNGKVYFLADPDGKGKELWVSDGTALGTKMVVNLDVTNDRSLSNLAVAGDYLYFWAKDDSSPGLGVLRSFLWFTDGVNVIKDNSDYSEIRVMNGRLIGLRNGQIKELQLIR